MMKYQHTLARPVIYQGVGLHTGKPVKMTVRPLPENKGIIFRRIDVDSPIAIEANISNLGNPKYSTTLVKDGLVVQTIEHLMAALAGIGLDNALIELDGTEIPAMDGSALPFIEKVIKAGLLKQDAPRAYLKIKRPIQHRLADRYIVALPGNSSRITCSINYDHPLLRNQKAVFQYNRNGFIQEIAAARTFGFLKDAEDMWRNGLAIGTSIENSIILTEEAILNDHLRYKDEFVRHKILDVIGDLSLLKFPFMGHLIVRKGGHHLHCQFIKKFLLSRDCWEIVELSEMEDDGSFHFTPFLPVSSWG